MKSVQMIAEAPINEMSTISSLELITTVHEDDNALKSPEEPTLRGQQFPNEK